jgi:hypothetical protein
MEVSDHTLIYKSYWVSHHTYNPFAKISGCLATR